MRTARRCFLAGFESGDRGSKLSRSRSDRLLCCCPPCASAIAARVWRMVASCTGWGRRLVRRSRSSSDTFAKVSNLAAGPAVPSLCSRSSSCIPTQTAEPSAWPESCCGVRRRKTAGSGTGWIAWRITCTQMLIWLLGNWSSRSALGAGWCMGPGDLVTGCEAMACINLRVKSTHSVSLKDITKMF